MKKIFNFIKKHTFYSTLIYVVTFIVLEFLLSMFNLMFRPWIYCFSLAVIILGSFISVIKVILKIPKKIIKILVIVIFVGLSAFFGMLFYIFTLFQSRPTYIVERENQKYVAYVYSPWDNTDVYYYKYVNLFVVSSKMSFEEFYDTPANPFENEEILRYKEGTVYYAEDGKTRTKIEYINDKVTYYYDEDGKTIVRSEYFDNQENTEEDSLENANVNINNGVTNVVAENYDISHFNEYFGKSVSYEKTVELLNKFCNEYYIYLSNSESKTGDNPGIYVYLSENKKAADDTLKKSIESSIKSHLKVLEDSVEATYNISVGENKKYGQYIYIERNDLKMLRGDFRITSKENSQKGNYDYIEDFKLILSSKDFIEDINNKYDIDITNNVKIWSLTTDNFLMNIGCEKIDTNKHDEYSKYVFSTFKKMVKNKYNLNIKTTTNFTEIVQ